MYAKILNLSIPNIISNITIPLVGMADLAIVGLLNDDIALSGIAIGTAIFNMLYYTFTFLRMGTSGTTAQAYGKKDMQQSVEVLLRGLALAILISIFILIVNNLIEQGSLWFMEGSEAVESVAASYYKIRIWAAPATLSLYVFQGWFIGMQNSKTPMWIALFINVINITLSCVFALTLSLGLDGVAYGTLIAQWSGVLLSLFALWRYYARIFRKVSLTKKSLLSIIDTKKLKTFFTLNLAILIRTVCLVCVFTYFTKASSAEGDTYLSANAILMQLFTLFSYFMDGFAYAGEALAGKFYGAGNSTLLRKAISSLFKIGLVMALLFTVLYLLFGENILSIFTDSPAVLSVASDYIYWAAAIPLCGFAAFLWDGILVGMTLSAYLRNSMMIAAAVFFAIYFPLVYVWDNAALWFAFLAFLATRGIVQWILTQKLLNKEVDISEFWHAKIEKLRKIKINIPTKINIPSLGSFHIDNNKDKKKNV
ncbi:MAG: MATE family efflux transporter [Rikenellaceae bacterium]